LPRISSAGAFAAGIALACALGVARPVAAEPWVAPGDSRLRHDLQVLYDRGLLTGPSLSWPLSWPDIARDLGRIDLQEQSPSVAAIVSRVRHRLDHEQRTDSISLQASVAVGADPSELRTFSDTPREQGEATLSADWLGQRFAWKASVTAVTDAADNQTWRPDGSYFGASLGNWMLSIGYLERWWGPGAEGTLLLSTNARPVPSISLERQESTPMDVPLLRWLGPWRFLTFMGQLEEDRDYPDALLFGMRIELRPLPSLQIAASRTAQWCGDGRPCDGGTFWDLLIGNDNDQDLSEQPGNQLAGFDVRWTWPGGKVPLALYAQAIGEDEAGFLPSKYLGLFGAEVWGEVGDGSWRAHVEYADTACDFLASPPEFGCAYTSAIYTDGYRYEGRSLGHSMDADGESIGFGGMLVDRAGHEWRVLLRNVKLNRAGAAPLHSLADGPAKVTDVELVHRRDYAWGTVEASLGYADTEADAGVDLAVQDGLRGYVSWRYATR
jgi:hypothetical protein